MPCLRDVKGKDQRAEGEVRMEGAINSIFFEDTHTYHAVCYLELSLQGGRALGLLHMQRSRNVGTARMCLVDREAVGSRL